MLETVSKLFVSRGHTFHPRKGYLLDRVLRQGLALDRLPGGSEDLAQRRNPELGSETHP
jgi:hypothetical protein